MGIAFENKKGFTALYLKDVTQDLKEFEIEFKLNFALFSIRHRKILQENTHEGDFSARVVRRAK